MMKLEHLKNLSSLAIVGATGLVGRETLSILEEHKIRIPKLRLLASKDSEEEDINQLTPESFEDIEVALFSTPNDVTQRFVPIAIESGCLVIDDSSLYRMKKDVPLVIPEINPHMLRDFSGKLISTPNCTVTPVAMVLKPLLDKYGLKRVVASTYQSVSGAGKAGFEELSSQTAELLNGKAVEPKAFPHQIAFNCIPMVGKATEAGDSEEELKFQNELRKILELDSLKVSATCVRVPTFCGHAASINVEFEEPFSSVEEIRETLQAMTGLTVIDNPNFNLYPTPMESVGSDETFVGRIRKDTTLPSAINFWVVTDNLRKGAALNSLQILDTYFHYQQMI